MAVVAVKAMIVLYACMYGVSPTLAIEIARLESDFAWDAVGDNGLAVGPYQIHLPLWREQRAKMGLSTEDLRLDPVENVRTAMFTMSRGLGCRWSTWDIARRNVTPPGESIVSARLRRVQARYEEVL